MHLHDDVSLEDLERRPQTVRLFCLLHADGVDGGYGEERC